MVGFVVVSHSCKLAEGVVDLTKMMAPDVPIVAAGGMEDGNYGTSFEKIYSAVEEVYSEEGVIILVDMGSAVMTAEMVIEAMDGMKVQIADCPVAEGAVAATVSSRIGMTMEEILRDLEEIGTQKKL